MKWSIISQVADCRARFAESWWGGRVHNLQYDCFIFPCIAGKFSLSARFAKSWWGGRVHNLKYNCSIFPCTVYQEDAHNVKYDCFIFPWIVGTFTLFSRCGNGWKLLNKWLLYFSLDFRNIYEDLIFSKLEEVEVT